jgi:chromosome segregation protein
MPTRPSRKNGDVRERLALLEGERQQREEAVAVRRAELEAATTRAEGTGADVTAIKVRVAERRERQQAVAAAVDALQRQRAELGERRTALDAEHAGAAAEHVQLEQDLGEARRREQEQVERRAALELAVGEAAAAVAAQADVLREIERHGRAVQAELEQLRTEHGRAEITHSEVRLRGDHLVEAIREKYERDLATVEPGEAEGDAEEERGRVDTLRQRLQRLGEVNLTAIDELREFEERGGFLRSQRDDLERSLGDLERTIQKLNRASRTRFAETFAKANETFQKVFPRLFRGGEGRLVLTNEDDLLETGVEIVVRPPGKRLDTVSLLSGGEKALVAVSLIFSLFLINPDAVLHSRRGGCAARRRQHRPLQPDDSRDERALAVHPHHAQQADHGERGRALRRDDARAGRLQGHLGGHQLTAGACRAMSFSLP